MLALTATALTDVSASVPPDVDAHFEDAVDAISDPAARAKEAEVITIGAFNTVSSKASFFAVSTPQVRHIGSLVRHRAPLYPLRQRNTARQVGQPFPLYSYPDVFFFRFSKDP